MTKDIKMMVWTPSQTTNRMICWLQFDWFSEAEIVLCLEDVFELLVLCAISTRSCWIRLQGCTLLDGIMFKVCLSLLLAFGWEVVFLSCWILLKDPTNSCSKCNLNFHENCMNNISNMCYNCIGFDDQRRLVIFFY
jgi:hypothetical protein